MPKKVMVLGMGGTIAGWAASPLEHVGYRAAQLEVAQLVGDALAPMSMPVGWILQTQQVAQIDSKDMAVQHWRALALAVHAQLSMPEIGAVVITHGTDTLEETAYFLSRVLPPEVLQRKAVVLTCAMRPASALHADGPQNLRDAVTVACTSGAAGVMVVCAGEVHGSLKVQKMHPYQLRAFDSAGGEPLGFLESGGVRWTHGVPVADTAITPFPMERLEAVVWPRVELLVSHAMAGAAMVQALCHSALDTTDPLRGIVVAGTGNGSVHEALEAALRQAQAQGIRVVRASRCQTGELLVSDTVPETFPHYPGLSAIKSRIALMLELMAE